MSSASIESEIGRFLSSEEPEIVCISGAWGVGKTFAWNRFLKGAPTKSGVALKRYSYVSLFGVNSLDEFKYAIFENTVKSTDIASEPSWKSIQSNTATVAKQLRKSYSFLQQLPYVKNRVGSLPPVWSLFVSKMIICIDDIERRGEGLHIRDIMGLSSTLKEHKDCKVVLILNDEALEDDERKDFETYYEKVVDFTLKFAPTAEECASIALSANVKTDQLLAERCVTLGISNIRLIKKIERAVKTLEPMLAPYDEKVLAQAIPSVVLFGWSIYEPIKAPPIEYLKKRNSAEYLLVASQKKQLSKEEGAWNALLDTYGFTNMDEFDRVLLEGLRNGYFDTDAVTKRAEELNKSIGRTKWNSSFSDAWGLFHDSLDDNEGEVVEALRTAFLKNVHYVSLLDLNETVTLFKELGREKEANELLRCYVENHGSERETFDLENYSFAENVTDPDVIRVFQEKLATFNDDRKPADVLLRITNIWNKEDVKFLSGLSVDEYYSSFNDVDP